MNWSVIIAALLPLAVAGLKKLIGKFGKNTTILLVVFATFLIAFLFNLGQSLITPEFLAIWAKLYATQAMVWALVIKYFGEYLLPKIKNNQ